MIASGYTIDVYCDCPTCDKAHHIGGWLGRKMGEFASDTARCKTECWKAMRKAGWKHYKETCTDYSPECLGDRKRIPKEWIEYHRNKDD